jgi:hypothetical protein
MANCMNRFSMNRIHDNDENNECVRPLLNATPRTELHIQYICWHMKASQNHLRLARHGLESLTSFSAAVSIGPRRVNDVHHNGKMYEWVSYEQGS